ncbi:hypothetical protein GBAR_LOCUS4810 [Geodia barretti]|uniref:Uncharacterized protein n=1 Tax=Geodia barretti TaxID=519541 RepID=A0AA35WAY5_GEOBA|nr:hypothetical protein GBAR_LOCUS4810 [Geodia barretti]
MRSLWIADSRRRGRGRGRWCWPGRCEWTGPPYRRRARRARRRRCHAGGAGPSVRRPGRDQAGARARRARRSRGRPHGPGRRRVDGRLHRRVVATRRGAGRGARCRPRPARVEAAPGPARNGHRGRQRPGTRPCIPAAGIPSGGCRHGRCLVHLPEAGAGAAPTAAQARRRRRRARQAAVRGRARGSGQARRGHRCRGAQTRRG